MASRLDAPRAPERALLVQLAHALGDRNPWFCNKENVPLAAGYMRALARARGVDQATDIAILPTALLDVAGDAAVVDAILQRDAAVVGFSLYPWNFDRSLAIAESLHAANPELLVVAGGPEVNRHTLPQLVGRGPIDIACLGEGEVTFSEILVALNTRRDLAQIEGIAILRDGAIVETPRRQTLVDLDEIPSPFLAGDLDARHYRQVHVLFERGCPYACKFCHWWPDKRSKGKFSLARIEAELLHLRAAGVEEVIVLDASLNSSKRFREFCEVLARVNSDHKLQIKVQVLFDRLDREQCEMLAKGGVRKLELGLQSASAATLKTNQRPTDLALFQHAMDITDGLGIGLQIDFIMGLPGDAVADVEATARFIRRMGEGKRVAQISPFVLSVGSATRLREEATSLGLRFQPSPPYRVLQSGALDYAILRSLRTRIPALLGQPEHPFFAVDRPHYAVNLFEPELYTFVSPDPARPRERGASLSDAATTIDAIRIRCDRQDPGHPHPFVAEHYARRLSQVVQIGFDLDSPEACLDHARATLAELSRVNPHTVWDVVIESRDAFAVDCVDQLLAAIPDVAHNLDWDNYFANPVEGDGRARIARRPFVVVPMYAVDLAWAREAARRFPLIYSLTVSDNETMKRDLDAMRRWPGEGLLIAVSEDAEPMLAARLVSLMLGIGHLRVRAFRNLALRALLEHETAKRLGLPRPRVPHRDRFVVTADNHGAIATQRFTRRQTLLDLTELCLAQRPGAGFSARFAATASG